MNSSHLIIDHLIARNTAIESHDLIATKLNGNLAGLSYSSSIGCRLDVEGENQRCLRRDIDAQAVRAGAADRGVSGQRRAWGHH